jgi:hypothetical protein
MKKQTSRVRIEFNGYWDWISSPRPYDYEIMGKYLFFSTDRQRLIDVATQEILHHRFHKAKVNCRLLGKNTEYVLCLYYKDGSRKHELANRCTRDYPDVKYRYWKSDESTLRGQYSQEFLSKLDVKRRRAFTAPKELVEFRDSKDKIILRQAIATKVRRARKRTTDRKDSSGVSLSS